MWSTHMKIYFDPKDMCITFFNPIKDIKVPQYNKLYRNPKSFISNTPKNTATFLSIKLVWT